MLFNHNSEQTRGEVSAGILLAASLISCTSCVALRPFTLSLRAQRFPEAQANDDHENTQR